MLYFSPEWLKYPFNDSKEKWGARDHFEYLLDYDGHDQCNIARYNCYI